MACQRWYSSTTGMIGASRRRSYQICTGSWDRGPSTVVCVSEGTTPAEYKTPLSPFTTPPTIRAHRYLELVWNPFMQ